MAKKTTKKTVETLTHEEASRKNIPTAEYQSVMDKEQQKPIKVAYERRNRDLDPQLVWRGKDEQDCSDLVVNAPPLYIQEKVHPKVLIDDLKRQTEKAEDEDDGQIDLFADFNGVSDDDAKTEFYQHNQHWSNRMILGDSLQVMASLAEREGLRGQVQCIYIDPPYGIKFNSNFQWSTTSRDVKDGNVEHITREPEQVKAFRDTWRDGIHSYLTYLRDRLTVARDLLTESGSVFVQIGDQNVHRVRAVMDEVFGEENFVSSIGYQTTPYATSTTLAAVFDTILWYSSDISALKVRQLHKEKDDLSSINRFSGKLGEDGELVLKNEEGDERSGVRLFQPTSLVSPGRASDPQPFSFHEKTYHPAKNSHWKITVEGLRRVGKASRLHKTSGGIRFRSMLEDYPISIMHNIWTDTSGGISSRSDEKRYVVQTSPKVVERCLLMATDPGDLVLDPTCGSGTTAYAAEQWGRRWITIDTSRVALALARTRIMGARFPYFILTDSRDGQLKEAEITRNAPSNQLTSGDIRHGFVYQRVPHIMLSSIANNIEIDVIWDKFEGILEKLCKKLNRELNNDWQEWEIPRKLDIDCSDTAKKLHQEWWKNRIDRQKEIDTSIAAKADHEYLYDKPFVDKKKVRVSGPFTVESLSPHRVLGVDEDGELIDPLKQDPESYDVVNDFTQMILENLKTAGVQQAHKEDKINFLSITAWPGDLVCAEGRYMEGDEETGTEKRAAIFIGPEFGTVQRADLVAAAKEAGDADFDTLIACAFNYEAHATEFDKLGRIPVLKARMNADLHMADDLKNTGKGNLFVIFGEPDIDILEAEDNQIQVKVNGVDVFHPNTGEVRSDGAEGIACWFVDTDYNEESFFVRQAYFLGANDPYKSLKTTLKAEISLEAWETLHSDTSRAFDKPKSGRIAVKVINHLGDEVMKVFGVN